jgi:hypothetical protein
MPDLADTYEEIARCAAGAVLYAEIAERYALTGDDLGLRHAAACLAAHAKSILTLTTALADLKAAHDRPSS